MEKKYFTPDIEDFHVGYEFQGKVYGEKDEWVNCLYSKPTDEMFCKDSDGNIWVNDSIRVPYLTKEQIEAEGWKPAAEDFFTPLFRKDNFTLGYRLEDNKLKIQTFGENSHTLYFGECKCINDFRKIQKLLNIKK